MTGLKIEFLVLLGVLEVALLFLVMAVVFVFRSRSLARQVRALQAQLKVAMIEPESVGFDQYLRDEVIRNQGLIDHAAVSEDPDDREALESLRLRKQFLELELTAQEAQSNPVELRNRIATGMQALIEMLRPEPETVTEISGEVAAEPQLSIDEAPALEIETERELHDTHDEELDHLRQVINNQQDAMDLLRARLQDGDSGSGDMDSILTRLDEFERHSRELHQCMEVLEAENERLKTEKQKGASSESVSQSGETVQLSGLKDMVGKQQATIESLHGLIKELAPDTQKAKELEDAMASIQHSNDELTGCVAVLEDENSMLRNELEEIQAFLDKQEALEEEAVIRVEEQPAAITDPVQGELEIKLQEMEALLEFKDATIEELEKQYNKLQSRYLADTGKTRID